MLSTWPRMAIVLPGASLGETHSTILHFVRHAAEVAALHVCVHVEHWLHVGVTLHRGVSARSSERRWPATGVALGRLPASEVDVNASTESTRCCGVWISTRYEIPVFGSTQ